MTKAKLTEFLKTAFNSLYEIGFLSYVILLFLSLGSDVERQMVVRQGMGFGLLALSFFLTPRPKGLTRAERFLFKFLSLFLIFEVARSLISLGYGMGWFSYEQAQLWAHSPSDWSLFAGLFAASFLFFNDRKRAGRLVWTLAGCSLFVSINAIPAFLIRGEAGYPLKEYSVFFFPLFYSSDFLRQYVFSSFGHVNQVGDLIGLGFFGAAGILVYRFERGWHDLAKGEWRAVIPLGIPGTIIGVCVTAIAWFQSRGTMLSFLAAFLFFVLALILRESFSRRRLVYTGALFIILAGFLVWASDMPGTLKELQTVEAEVGPEAHGSFQSNIEAGKRALRIFRDHSFWGVGRLGYSSLSLHYASPGLEEELIPRTRAMSHYFQVLADEGLGAFFYFAFLVLFWLLMVRRLYGVKSNFQFVVGLSLFSAVSMVYLHALIHQLLEQFSFIVLIPVVMGAALSVLSPEFGSPRERS